MFVATSTNPATLADLSPQARAAFDQGMTAAQRGDWNGAMRHLRSIKEPRVLPAIVLFNLGVAHAGAGRELEAASWYSAYLAVVPTAPNSGDVRREIARLEHSVEEKAHKILDEAARLAEAMPDENRKRKALDEVLRRDAHAAYAEGALPLAAGLALAPDRRDIMWMQIAQTFASAGDLDRARRAQDMIHSPQWRNDVQHEIAWFLSDIDELQPALKEVEALTDDSRRTAYGIAYLGGSSRVRPARDPKSVEETWREPRLRLGIYEGYRQKGMKPDAERIMGEMAANMSWDLATRLDDRYIIAIADFQAAHGNADAATATRRMLHAGILDVWLRWTEDLSGNPAVANTGAAVREAGAGTRDELPGRVARVGCTLAMAVHATRRLRAMTDRGLREQMLPLVSCI